MTGQFARVDAAFLDQLRQCLTKGELLLSHIATRQRHDHFNAVAALWNKGNIQNTRGVDALLQHINHLLKNQLRLRVGRHFHRVHQAHATAQILAKAQRLVQGPHAPDKRQRKHENEGDL